jgi:AsmA protein
MKKILLRLVKYTGLTLGGILLLLFLWPIVFPGTAARQIKQWVNANIDGELNFSEARLSFFRHFPTLTLTLHDFSLTGSAPFERDTLLAGEALGFGLDVLSLFRETIDVHSFYLDNSRINVQVDEQGRANYNIYKGNSADKTEPDSSNTRLKIAGVFVNRCQLTYHDRSLPMLIEARDFYYEGRGDLASNEFDLQSEMRAASFDFVYDSTAYLLQRKLQADLVTRINTASLAFRFTKNNLLINKLPVDFTGDMTILKDGYDIDLNVVSGTTDFGNIFSALPPEYDQWFAETKFSGQSQIRVAMKGNYRAATGEAPDLDVRLWVRDGSVQHNLAPTPLEHFFVNATVRIPGLNPDSLSLAVDTLRFEVNGEPTRATFYLRGLDQPYIKTEAQSRLDLALFAGALQLTAAGLYGRLDLQLHADGYYRTAIRPGKTRPDTVITAIPAYHLEAGVEKGYFKLRDFEMPVQDISTQIRSDCPTGKLQDISFALDTFHFVLGEGQASGRLAVKGLEKSVVQANVKADLLLEDLARAVPIQDYVFRGAMRADVQANGVLDADNKRFPVVDGALEWNNGFLQTPFYPNPIEQIRLNGSLHGKSGGYRDLSINVRPLSFTFEQQPFTLTAELQNPDDWRYHLAANGTLDLGRIYRVFALEGYEITGLLQADLDVQGAESDARAGRYDRIRHKGTLRLKNVKLHSDDYPDPFYVPGSTLRFEADKAWLSDAVLRYRKNEFTLNGFAQNFIGHLMSGSTLKGQLSVACPLLVIDDFTAFAAPAKPAAAAAKPTKQAASTGVVLLPNDLELALQASIKEIVYGETRLQNGSGQVSLKQGQMLLEQTKFDIAGATFGFEGSYAPVNARKAGFTFAVKADSFDVQRAYREIPMFRDMAGAAEKAEGLISLEYRLQGRLNDRMEPVYPSIKGEGFLKMEQVKVNGLKLFGAVSKATGKDGINDPEMKAVVMKSSIANNIITIARTKMKVHGFRPRIEGQTSLDGRLNLRFRLGLPPFGLIGIPMTITGTSEQPEVHIRRGKESDELEEEMDEEDAAGLNLQGQTNCEAHQLAFQAEQIYRSGEDLERAANLYYLAFKRNYRNGSAILDAITCATTIKNDQFILEFLKHGLKAGLEVADFRRLWSHLGNSADLDAILANIDTTAIITAYHNALDQNLISRLQTMADRDQAHRSQDIFDEAAQRANDSINWRELKFLTDSLGRLPTYTETGFDGAENLEIIFYHIDKAELAWFLPYLIKNIKANECFFGSTILYQLERIGMSEGVVYTITDDFKIIEFCPRTKISDEISCQSFGQWFSEPNPEDNTHYFIPIEPKLPIAEVNRVRSLFCLDAIESKWKREPWVKVLTLEEFKEKFNLK